ncbi:MAG: phosphonoacetaldehyde hydrolase [Paenibacillus sp.]|nr:phosphonoacetaldehyde hydrolase [Paenibacillus sp.]
MRKPINRIEAVLFDWAGTMVDYGCMAPLAAFIDLFRERGIDLTVQEAREPMGLLKRDHLRRLLALPSVSAQWQNRYGQLPGEAELDELYRRFEAALFATLGAHTEPVPGALELVRALRHEGIRIGSTSGYTKQMLTVVAEGAAQKGYRPDYWIAADEVAAGRPAPYMCYRNMIELQVYPAGACVKVGDTLSDIAEGRNAGMWTVGVIVGGSELGLTEQEVQSMNAEQLALRKEAARSRFLRAGAHEVIDSIRDLAGAVGRLDNMLAELRRRGEEADEAWAWTRSAIR